MQPDEDQTGQALERERLELLLQLDEWMETPLVVLGFVWLALLVAEFGWGLSPLLQTASTLIWIIFILDFVIKFILAPHKAAYLRTNWLTALSLIAPALRVIRAVAVVRLLRTARAARSLRLLRVVSSINRGMKALRASMARRGLGYLTLLTAIITFAGAAGMYAFESDVPNGLESFGFALWWTLMLMTTLGSDYWPQSAEGRILTFLLSLYALAVFGYITASLASFFIGQERAKSGLDEEAVAALHSEIAALRAEVAALHSTVRKKEGSV